MVVLVALWAMAVLPLLALPVDWAVVCGCDACPFEGGPNCCCRLYPTWDNADGSPGHRAVIGKPHTVSSAERCLESMAAPSATEPFSEPLGLRGAIVPDEQDSVRSQQSAGWLGKNDAVPTLLPRPPPR